MTINSNTQKNNLATAYAAAATHAALYTTGTGISAGTEPSSPYARVAVTWNAAGAVGPLGAGTQPATPGVIYGQALITVPAGVTVVAAGLHSAASGSNYLDGGDITDQNFATQGTYTLNIAYTQT